VIVLTETNKTSSAEPTFGVILPAALHASVFTPGAEETISQPCVELTLRWYFQERQVARGAVEPAAPQPRKILLKQDFHQDISRGLSVPSPPVRVVRRLSTLSTVS
jgi:hypothetical protein